MILIRSTRISPFLLLVFTGTVHSTAVYGQSVTSPYSILGIGDVETKDVGRYFITGNTSIARRNSTSYNYANPASLSSLQLKMVLLDVGLRGRSSQFTLPSADTSTGISKDFTVKRISLAFKLNNKTGIAIGMKPYSSVNYQFNNDEKILDGNTTYTKYVEGSGGINQVYASAGTALGKHVSAGLTASWLFGSLKRTTYYYSSNIDLDLSKEDYDFYNGAQLTGGLQYYSLPGKKWSHTIGLTASVSTSLKGQLTSSYIDQDVTLTKTITDNRKFSMPVTAGFAYSATKNNRFTLTAEGNYYGWDYQKVDYKNSYTGPATRFSVGMEYSFQQKGWQQLIEKSFVGWGISAENSYLRINNQKLWDYSLSFGGGFSPLPAISTYGGIELGIKGQQSSGQIKEKYTQFTIGICIKDIWVGTKKYGRYN